MAPRYSHADRDFVEGDAEPMPCLGLGGDAVVASAQVLIEAVSQGEGRAEPQRFWPQIGRSCAFSRPWPVSIGLFACCSTAC